MDLVSVTLRHISQAHMPLLSSARYLDAVGGQGLCSQSLLSRISQSTLPSLSLERIFQNARISGRHCWGEEYPEDELLDDLENYRPLEALHRVFLLRSRIWELAVAKYKGKRCPDTPETLMKEIKEIGEVRKPFVRC